MPGTSQPLMDPLLQASSSPLPSLSSPSSSSSNLLRRSNSTPWDKHFRSSKDDNDPRGGCLSSPASTSPTSSSSFRYEHKIHRRRSVTAASRKCYTTTTLAFLKQPRAATTAVTAQAQAAVTSLLLPRGKEAVMAYKAPTLTPLEIRLVPSMRKKYRTTTLVPRKKKPPGQQQPSQQNSDDDDYVTAVSNYSRYRKRKTKLAFLSNPTVTTTSSQFGRLKALSSSPSTPVLETVHLKRDNATRKKLEESLHSMTNMNSLQINLKSQAKKLEESMTSLTHVQLLQINLRNKAKKLQESFLHLTASHNNSNNNNSSNSHNSHSVKDFKLLFPITERSVQASIGSLCSSKKKLDALRSSLPSNRTPQQLRVPSATKKHSSAFTPPVAQVLTKACHPATNKSNRPPRPTSSLRSNHRPDGTLSGQQRDIELRSIFVELKAMASRAAAEQQTLPDVVFPTTEAGNRPPYMLEPPPLLESIPRPLLLLGDHEEDDDDDEEDDILIPGDSQITLSTEPASQTVDSKRQSLSTNNSSSCCNCSSRLSNSTLGQQQQQQHYYYCRRCHVPKSLLRFVPHNERSLKDQLLYSLTQSERNCLALLRQFWDADHHPMPGHMYLRFARFCQFNLRQGRMILSKFDERYLTLNASQLEPQLLSKTIFPIPGLKSINGLDMFYMRPSLYYPHKTKTQTIIDNLAYVMMTMVEKEEAATHGIGMIAHMKDWTMENFSVDYCRQFMKMLQGGVPARVCLVLFVNPPTWFGTIWKIMKAMLHPTFSRNVKMIPEHSLGQFLAPGYRAYLPKDATNVGTLSVTQHVHDFVAYRKFVEENKVKRIEL